MGDVDRLAAATLSPGSGASFIATRHAALARIKPLTEPAASWLHRIVADGASWDGRALFAEPYLLAGVAEAVIAAGFTFEHDARPN